MNIPVLGSINWLWLVVGALLGWFILPKLSGRFGIGG